MDISKLTIKEIKELINGQLHSQCLDEEVIEALSKDKRAGVQKLYQYVKKQRQKTKDEYLKLLDMLKYEQELLKQGKQYIAGVDEAGRGPLAGPVVAAAVILPQKPKILGIDDSKKLPAGRRKQLAEEIKQKAAAWAVGEASVEEICTLNIYHASLLAMKRALDKLAAPPDYILIDAVKVPEVKIPQKAITGGDKVSASIAAASIIAKTYRDELMEKIHQQYPQYGFNKHKGYPTAEHLEKLRVYGPCTVHRMSYAPVMKAYKKEEQQKIKFK
ncbi:MAG: ribonuclease HII [Desulfotomaculum sp.]|nr:ribonuclease HII [Desulfotomaculum sp.]